MDELGGAESAMSRVWPAQVEVDAPVLQEDPRIEELAVRNSSRKPAVEGLDPGVLPGRAGIDEHGVGPVEPGPVTGVRTD